MSDALWTEEHRSHLPKVGEQDVPETNWSIYGSIYRRHVGEIGKSRAPHNPFSRGVPGPEMLLNPAKCTFRVSIGKFLGFIVNRRGIKANLDKIKVVLDMLPKDIQRLTGRIDELSRFVSKAIEKCQPFFQVLKKVFQWDTHCKEAFTTLKTYLRSPPILISPSKGELLTLYLAVLEFSTSAALVIERNRV